MRSYCFALLAAFALVGGAQAQSFSNGDFETGSLSGWTVTFTPNGNSVVQNVVQYDIDGPSGPLGTNFAANFEVGQASFISGDIQGLTLLQPLNLVGGTTYTFSYDFSSHCNLGSGSNADGGRYEILADGNSIASFNVGSIAAQASVYGFLTGQFTPATSGSYQIGARIRRSFLATSSVDEYVDNFAVAPVPEPATIGIFALGFAALIRRRRR